MTSDPNCVWVVTAKPGADPRAAIAAAAVDAGGKLVELRPLAMTLEDIFLEVTARSGA